MLFKTFRPLLYLVLAMALVGMACSFGSAPAPATETAGGDLSETAAPIVTEAPTMEAATTEAPTLEAEATAETPRTGGASSGVSGVQGAIIQIEAQGTFVDPEVGLQLNRPGRGSGFIIDPSGLAVTNNHVVTGAALLKVRLSYENEWRNARIVAVSECSDLAVIDIDGDGFPYLEWSPDELRPGDEMYVAGFPLGDPEYTLTKGVISKAQARGETNWASVDSVIEYDANALPGNSGGPVVDPQGRVIGIHYASNQSTRQAFGISRNAAQSIVDRLKNGEDVDSIGLNGVAVASEDGSLTGIWVSSVQSGSPADQAGVRPGDIVYMLENLVLGVDGTMADYCDILRTHQPTDTMSLSVIRFNSGELLEGQLNGRELAVTGAFDVSGGESGSTENGGTSGPVTGGNGVDVYNFDASESGDVIFYTEFDADLSDWAYFLTSGKEQDVDGSTADSKLRMEINGTQTYVYLLNEQFTSPDVRIDVTAENRGRNNNNVSLICRYSDDRGWYEFNIANNGEYTILRYDMVNQRYVPLFTGGSRDIRTGQDTNEYTAVCNGEELSLYINTRLARTVTDRNLKDGQVGLSVSSFNVTPIIVEFDHFIVSVP
ncbi:MAG TPA: S1C family serine protease [Anaerolineales bacterium]|nr:S1C family serine protease [Anaerolineales bacterium]